MSVTECEGVSRIIVGKMRGTVRKIVGEPWESRSLSRNSIITVPFLFLSVFRTLVSGDITLISSSSYNTEYYFFHPYFSVTSFYHLHTDAR